MQTVLGLNGAKSNIENTIREGLANGTTQIGIAKQLNSLGYKNVSGKPWEPWDVSYYKIHVMKMDPMFKKSKTASKEMAGASKIFIDDVAELCMSSMSTDTKIRLVIKLTNDFKKTANKVLDL